MSGPRVLCADVPDQAELPDRQTGCPAGTRPAKQPMAGDTGSATFASRYSHDLVQVVAPADGDVQTPAS